MSVFRQRHNIEIAGVPRVLMLAGINSLLLLLVAAGVYGIAYLLSFASSITIPLLLAVVIGMIAYPLVKLGDRAKLPRALTVTLVILTVVALVLAAISLTVTSVLSQGPEIAEQMVRGISELGTWLLHLFERLGFSDPSVSTAIQEVVNGATGALESSEGGEGLDWGQLGNLVFGGGDNLLNLLKGSVSSDDVASALQGLGALGFSLFIGLTLLFYILNDYDNIFHWIGCHLGVADEVGLGLVEDATRSMRGYFTGTTISAATTSILTGVALWVLDVPLVIPIVVVTFLLSYVPFLGAIVATAFAVIIALGSGGLATALWVLVVSLFVQNILQTVLNAKLLGDSLELHPVVVLIATIAGSVFAGLLGATLGAPFTAMFVRMSRRLRVEKTGIMPAVDYDPATPPAP